MLGKRKFLPLGDTARWYIPGRNEFYGAFSLSRAEFEALNTLFPLVAQFKEGRYECTCTTEADAQQVSLVLCGIRQYVGRAQSAGEYELNAPLSAAEAEFITAQLPARREMRDGKIYLFFHTQALLLRAQVIVSSLRCPEAYPSLSDLEGGE